VIQQTHPLDSNGKTVTYYYRVQLSTMKQLCVFMARNCHHVGVTIKRRMGLLMSVLSEQKVKLQNGDEVPLCSFDDNFKKLLREHCSNILSYEAYYEKRKSIVIPLDVYRHIEKYLPRNTPLQNILVQ